MSGDRPNLTDGQRADLLAAVVNLAHRAEAEADPERAAHLAAAARHVAETLTMLAPPRASRGQTGPRSPFIQALKDQAATRDQAS